VSTPRAAQPYAPNRAHPRQRPNHPAPTRHTPQAPLNIAMHPVSCCVPQVLPRRHAAVQDQPPHCGQGGKVSGGQPLPARHTRSTQVRAARAQRALRHQGAGGSVQAGQGRAVEMELGGSVVTLRGIGPPTVSLVCFHHSSAALFIIKLCSSA
jgi:hypothetical protein